MKFEAASCNRQTGGSEQQRAQNEYDSNSAAREELVPKMFKICVCMSHNEDISLTLCM